MASSASFPVLSAASQAAEALREETSSQACLRESSRNFFLFL